MPLPVGLQSVTVAATNLCNPDGEPLVGYVLLVPEPKTLTAAGADAIITGPARMDVTAGAGTVTVLATDAAGVSPSGWTYRFYERWQNGHDRDYPVSLPAAAPAVNLADIAPSAPSVGEYVVVTGPSGPAGPSGAAIVRPSFSGARVQLTGYPDAMGLTDAIALPKDSWRFMPLTTAAPMAFDYLAISTSAAASGGTALMVAALYETTADGRPGAVHTAWPGSIDLTATGENVLYIGAQGPIPAGDWFVAVAWSGTAGVDPTLACPLGNHPRVAGNFAGTNRNAYQQAVSGTAAPDPATPSATATIGVLLWGVVS